ncbi:MAG: hypothetical protein U0893_07250 [Chloroflexota bacterium]
MSDERDDYELGTDVTRQARPKERRSTAVLSVRLPIADIVALENASETSGKTTAQLVREAISAYLPAVGLYMNQPSITISWGAGGQTFSTGPMRSSNRATQSETRPWSSEAATV